MFCECLVFRVGAPTLIRPPPSTPPPPDIPVEATGENVPEPITSFEDIELGPALMANVKR